MTVESDGWLPLALDVLPSEALQVADVETVAGGVTKWHPGTAEYQQIGTVQDSCVRKQSGNRRLNRAHMALLDKTIQ